MKLDLTSRQQNILLAIVLDYTATAEPIGSRTISKRYNLGLSPATIRNEMAELEESGLLEQPHTSSGRIPSELGYRTFVDYLMEKPPLSEHEIEIIRKNIGVNPFVLENIIEKSARILSGISNSLAIVEFPKGKKDYVRHFQLLSLNENSLIIVVVLNSGEVINFRVQLEIPVDDDLLAQLTKYFNEELRGTPIDTLKFKLGEIIFENSMYDSRIKDICNSIRNNLEYDNKGKYCIYGTGNLLKEPEFSDNEKVKYLIDFVEKAQKLTSVFDGIEQEKSRLNDEISIFIGKEIPTEELQGFSLIVGNYNVKNYGRGSVALLGPTRMKYGKSVVVLEEFIKNLNDLLLKYFI